MIKGINHQIIEVTDTKNKYYERALLVLRPEYSSIQRELLEKEARILLKKMDTISSVKPKHTFAKKLIHSFLYCAVGSLVTILIYAIF